MLQRQEFSNFEASHFSFMSSYGIFMTTTLRVCILLKKQGKDFCYFGINQALTDFRISNILHITTFQTCGFLLVHPV